MNSINADRFNQLCAINKDAQDGVGLKDAQDGVGLKVEIKKSKAGT
jgi:hypothetical protein